jgi:DNA-binding transcriptional LysR family regulator
MEMQQVRYFLAVARTLNFTRAAEQCNVTQPALTRAIKQLEDELGGELIRREGRLSHLTDLGMRMLPPLTQCYESAQGAKVLAAKVKSGDIATLAIGVSLTLDVEVLLKALTELQRAFAGMQLVIRRGGGNEIAEWLKNGDIELAFGGPLGETWDRLDTWPMFSESFDLVIAKDHALASVNDVELQVELLQRTQLLLHSLDDGIELNTTSLEASGIKLEDAHKVNCNRDLEALVQAKFGVAILPESSFRSDGLHHMPYPGLKLERTVAVYSIAGRARSREATALLGLVRSADWQAKLAA